VEQPAALASAATGSEFAPVQTARREQTAAASPLSGDSQQQVAPGGNAQSYAVNEVAPGN
jgi:hypothetical protein